MSGPALAASLEDACAAAARGLAIAWAPEAAPPPEDVARAAEGGVAALLLRMHADGPAAHDHHGGAGDHARLAPALQEARRRGLALGARTELSRSTFRSLAGLPSRLARHRVAAWALEVPRRSDDETETAFLTRHPRLALALPRALHAAADADRRGISVFLRGAPLCLLGPFAPWSLPEERAYATVCDGCPARASCPGVDATYLARFAADELRPRPAPKPPRHREPWASWLAGR
ncbi:MAG TPA: hypothetical protein RMH85_15510 [Polyangiaceae bacterium LLY-WYZ-15_(1-7)]|nr:hypothetical protein [Myxococcales bacterium]HJK92992.1 hypothetical protein [Polyangiaceae bacterium LLY-WYZ-15_(1-7)]HJL05789.1 hypothetical protein [Polyangiaceae bacterium LLY-WYZ-15_(1-7)]HJL09907.1 hypothetical protein [Polyangiaceae bacterium LLY-WYZ-15_(1-7)]HJL35513.1 hypothetical protein [Polyangiaceae bacterium LLY-WYZ-15_(1-7)]